jgi:hypothetical protein
MRKVILAVSGAGDQVRDPDVFARKRENLRM